MPKIKEHRENEFLENMESLAGMFNALKYAIKLKNQEYWKGHSIWGQYREKGILFNAIVEPVKNYSESDECFAAKIEINGMSDFDTFENKKPGIHRYGLSHSKDKRNPANIERISIIIDDEIVEFVRCQ